MTSRRATTLLLQLPLTLLPIAHAEATDPGDSQSIMSSGLQEVVVAAQRQKTAAGRPIMVTALSGHDLATSGVTNMTEISLVVPGLHVDSFGNFLEPSLRGIGWIESA